MHAPAPQAGVPVQTQGTCPTPSLLVNASLGQLDPATQQQAFTHLRQCQSCTSMMHKLTEQMAAFSGRMLYKGHLIWPNDWSWLRPYEKYLGPDAAAGMSKKRIIDRRFTLIQMARSVRFVPGSTGECGVLGGVGSAMISKTLENSYRDGESHWGFDSFEGLSEPSELDKTKYAWQKKGSLAISMEVAKQNLSDFPFVKLCKGWIPECFGPAMNDRFRLAHIDLDLHQPTLDSLDFFYPRMNVGGVFVFDDYGHLTCLGVRQAINEYFSDKPEQVLETVDGIAFAYKK